jgi:hypothetical protein
MGMADVVALIAQDQYEAVKIETWGHLAPAKNVAYPVEFVAAVGWFSDDISNPILLSCKSMALGEEEGPFYGPWFYDSVREFISERLGKDKNEGRIFRFTGHWRNYKFVGKFKQLRIVD